nr:hypothetical protein [Tanacetum cinerariifolium]
MASNLENVRLSVLAKLQEALDDEDILADQILTMMHRYADRFTNRRVEFNNLMVLQDHPLVDYGKYALGCMTGADMKKCVHLKSVRDELLRNSEDIQCVGSDHDYYQEAACAHHEDHVMHDCAQNDMFRAENNKIKQHYKELYDSIKITRAKHIEQVTKLTTENVNLKTCVSKATVNPQVSARDKHAIDVEPIVPRLRNNRDAHLDYLRHLKESVETIRDIVEEAKVYAIGTCPQGSQQRAKQLAHIPLIRKKQVTVAKPSDKSDSTIHRHVVTVKSQKTNVPVPPSTANRISPAKGDNKLPVDDQPRKNKSHLRTSNCINSSSRLKRTVINSHSDSVFQTCNKCLTPFNHDLCVATYLQYAMATPSIRYNSSVKRKVKQVWKPKPVRQVWKPTGQVLTTIGHQ